MKQHICHIVKKAFVPVNTLQEELDLVYDNVT